MKVTAVLFVALAVFASAAFGSIIDKKIIAAIENVQQEIIDDGYDPLVLDRDFSFDIKQKKLKIKGSVSDITISNWATFSIDSLDVQTARRKVSFQFSWDDISVTGAEYSLAGTIERIIPIYGEGPFSVDITGVTATGGLQIEIDPVQLGSVTFTLSLDAVTTNFEYLLGNADLSDQMNALISSLIPEIYDSVIEPEIEDVVVPAVVDKINAYLAGDSTAAVHFRKVLASAFA